MATTDAVTAIDQIGETAGIVWRVLSDGGRMTFAKLVKAVDQPRDNVMQAIGWLAREGKVQFEDQGRNRYVSLR